jgi:hypothetical protein
MTKSRGILRPRKHWTAAELSLLASMYPHCHTADVAAWLQRASGPVYQAAAVSGLRKSAEYLASDSAGRVKRGKQHPSMIRSQFHKGMTPWNKGRPSAETGTGHHPNSRRTQFKADGSLRGAAQHNYVPVGSLRICADGYLERKVTDDPSLYPARRWVAVHRLVWEATNGAIPRGHIVRFKAGQKTTVLAEITPDRLECITRAENAHRNHPRSRSPELAKLVQLKGAITRQVNRIAREAQERT